MGFCKPSLKVGFRLTARLKGLILKACDGAPLDRGSTRAGAERIRVRFIVSAEAEMSDLQREIYHSENGDRWLLCRDDDGRVFVLHKANVSSGGTATKIELGDFLGRGKAGPEHQALARLIGGLVDRG
jgi:hypothetical protein